MHESDPMHLCGARTRSGEPCQNPPVDGRTRCRMHGGATPVGVASPSYKDGRHSRYLPERLLERYEEAQNDPELLSLHAEIALTDARLMDLLGRVDTGESGALWRKAQQLMQRYRDSDDGLEQMDLLGELEQTILAGVSDYAAWDEVNKQLRQRKTLAESERKRLVEMQQTITAEKAMLLVTALTTSIRRHVTDPAALAAISADLVRLTGAAVGSLPATSSGE